MICATDELKRWIGKTQTASDHVTVAPLKALSATLDRADPEPQPGQPIPPCWHWLYFLPATLHSEIGPDGHPKRGDFMPPVPLPTRMWAGSQLEYRRPLRVGDFITKRTCIADVTTKSGRSGPLVFIRLLHEIAVSEGIAVIDQQDIVYRGPTGASASSPHSVPAPHMFDWSRTIFPDDVLLFRYSALTFNAHRIHYNARYANDVENYPGLVVHGPLLATLLLDLVRRHMPHAEISLFNFRGVKPAFDHSPIHLYGRRGPDGKTLCLWARDGDGDLTMHASAVIA